jgi:hypothetical protein
MLGDFNVNSISRGRFTVQIMFGPCNNLHLFLGMAEITSAMAISIPFIRSNIGGDS